MAKGNQKVKAKDAVEQGFGAWKKALKELQSAADKSYMPLLAKSIEVDIAIIETYERAFTKAVE